MDELRECPFCGCGASLGGNDEDLWRVCCDNCNAAGACCLKQSEAIAAWNTRTAQEMSSDAMRWDAFRNRDTLFDLRLNDFHNAFRDDADLIIDEAIEKSIAMSEPSAPKPTP